MLLSNTGLINYTKEWFVDYQEFNEASDTYILNKSQNNYRASGNRFSRNLNISNIDSNILTMAILRNEDGRYNRPPRSSGILNFMSIVNITEFDEASGQITLSASPLESHLPIRIYYQHFAIAYSPKPINIGINVSRSVEYLNQFIVSRDGYFSTAVRYNEDTQLSQYYKQYADSTRTVVDFVIRQRGSLDNDKCLTGDITTISIDEFDSSITYDLNDEVYFGDNIYRKIASGNGLLDNINIWQLLITL